MRVFMFVIVISYGFDVVLNYKMQLQAKIKLKKDFLQNYLRSGEPASVHLDLEVPPGLANVLQNELGKQALRMGPEDVKEEVWSRDLNGFPQLVKYLSDSSVDRFRTSLINYSNKLIQDISSESLRPDINSTINFYKAKLQQHADYLLKYNPKCQVDTDVLLLDIVQISNRLVYEETVKCLQNLLEDDSLKSKANVQSLVEEIFKNNLQKKKEDFQFLCKMMKLCRPFPGFSDYLADVFGELSRLPENKLHTLIMKTIVIAKKKNSDIIHLLGHHLVNKLDKEVQKVIYDDLSAVRNALAANRKDIFERYKAKKVSDKTKAFRLLLDMVDKAFQMDGPNEVTKHFNIITKALRSWVAGQEVDIQETEHKFLDYVTDTLSAKWGNDANKEVRTLVHVIVDGKPGHNVFNYILVNGSHFVNQNL